MLSARSLEQNRQPAGHGIDAACSLAPSDSYHVATAGCCQLPNRNAKPCEEIPDLHFIPVSLVLRGRLNQGVSLIGPTEHFLHVEGVPLFLPR